EILYDSFLQDMFINYSSVGNLTKIKNVCQEITVGIVVNPSKYYAESGVPGIRHSNVMKGEIDISEVVYIDPIEHRKLQKTHLNAGDVVLPRVSTVAGKPYYAAVVPKELDGVNSIGIVILRPDKSKVLPEFLEACINAPSTVRRLVGVAVGSIQRQLNVGIIKEEKIPLPSITDQSEIAQRSLEMKECTYYLRKRVRDSEKIKQYLYTRVFQEI
ncbi:hypothetical protein LC608_31790, partial [Nostoc sp. XA010]|uniref:hypothetical protein n=1 Tax=Nostoc sp. XA010 TaxID=2780407 RepID=UPI001E428BD8